MPSLPLSIPLIICIPMNSSLHEDDHSVGQSFEDPACPTQRDSSCSNRWEEDCSGHMHRHHHEAATRTKSPPKPPRRMGSGNMYELLEEESESETSHRGDHSPKLPRRSWTLGDGSMFQSQDADHMSSSPKTEAATRSLPDSHCAPFPKLPKLRRYSATQGALAA